MFIATVPNRNSPPAILLRESYCENGKVKSRTLANLSMLPPQAIEALRLSLKGEKLAPLNPDSLQVIDSPQHGQVQAGSARYHEAAEDRRADSYALLART